MTKIIAAKHKIDRRLGVNLWGRPKSPLNTRNFGPGQHGKGRKKVTDYGQQLHAKQRLKGYYGRINEKQFRRLYDEAIRRKGDTGENLIGLLESRLDTIVYRCKWGNTVFASRQLVSHGQVCVNGARVNIASYIVKQGDVVSIREGYRQNANLQGAIDSAERTVPEYLAQEGDMFSYKFSYAPKLADVPYPAKMEPNLVVEFYSR
jgi:small subunit ribosomal protein S4